MDRRVLILGAGVSGLSVGWKLATAGVAVDLIEAQPHVGGLAGTVREDGYCLDFGPHSFFSEDLEIVHTVLNLFDHPLSPTSRSVKLYYQGRYLDYPITATSVLFQMGFSHGVRAMFSFMKGRVASRRTITKEEAEEDQSVEEWATQNFGEYLYRTFFKPYTEQFWLMPCQELSARTIPTHTRLSFAKTLTLLIRRRLQQGEASLIERERLETYYPATGYGEIAEQIARRVQEAGGRIHVNSRALEVVRLPGGDMRVSVLHNGLKKDLEGSDVVSTIPIHLLVKMLQPTPPRDVLASAENMDYRPLLVLGLVIERQDALRASYVYFLDRPYNRVAEMNKFSPQTSPQGENLVAVEIPTLRESPTWSASKEALFDRCIGSLEADGIVSRREIKRLLLVKAPYAYPIYRRGYAKDLQCLLDYIQQCPGLSTLGRTGEFMYMDADKCIRRAFDLADRLLPGVPGQKDARWEKLLPTDDETP